MNMLYHIMLVPTHDNGIGIGIKLFPAWKTAVKESGLTQDKINTAIANMHRDWLDSCGYGQMTDPDKSPMDEWEEKKLGKTPKLGPKAHKLYGTTAIRISWGEWGPEHITCPGDACGLDIDSGYGAPKDGKVLHPHNVDHYRQTILLLTIFLWLAEGFVLDAELKENK